jgi:small conductance mechanosensitive channel
MDMAAVQTFVSTTLVDLGLKVLAAIAFWVVGRG